MVCIQVGGLTFEPGQAVYIVRPRTMTRPVTPIAGVVTRAPILTAGVLTADGQRSVNPTELIHCGYCPRCDTAAHLDRRDRLVCPKCGRDASAPVPDHRQPTWKYEAEETYARAVRIMFATGCCYKEAHWAVGRPSRPVVIPIARPVDDSEPDADTNTLIDRWLDRQFKKAA
jgi:hypothetical protein